MILDKALNGNNTEVSNSESIYLGVDLRAVVMSDVVDNSSLRNETKSILREACAGHSASSHDHNQSEAKEKEVEIVVQHSSTECRPSDLHWLEDDFGHKKVGNEPIEKVENKLRTLLKK